MFLCTWVKSTAVNSVLILMLDIFILTSWFVCHEETIGHLFHYSKNFYILTYILKYTISVIKYVTKLVCGKCIIFPKGYLLICNTGL